MIKATFGLSETGSVRNENQDSYLVDVQHGLFAVADGLGGLPNGARASSMTVDILRRKLSSSTALSLLEAIMEVNEETRRIGFNLDVSGFGSTLTMARYYENGGLLELAHIGDSAAYLIKDGVAQLLTQEHTVAARMVAERWQDAADAIPLSAHHTLTQCIGQNLYIDPQIIELSANPGNRLFLMTDGITKPITQSKLEATLVRDDPIEKICQSLTFQAEAGGSPDNYTVVAVEF
jgi:protein phosphatase